MKPLHYNDFILVQDIDAGQIDIALKFRESVFGDDLSVLEAVIAKEDLARLTGRFEVLKESHELLEWQDFLGSIHSSLKEKYAAIKDDYNTSASIRYTKHGEGIYLFFDAGNEGIKEGGEALLSYPVAIVAETEFSVVDGKIQYGAIYKVKIFDSIS